ncbi:hypothetical protein BGX38DRAFT_1140658 [Terfezia claveryi]|nr:hypothetical protein BGX38DRAFT_1140658 [Terfezia claveryi]
MSALDIDELLANMYGGADYANLPLGTDPDIFQMISIALRGRLRTFEADFKPPGLQNPNYVPPNRGLAVMIFGLTTLAVAIIVVIVRLLTKSLRAAGGRIKRGSEIGGLTSSNDRKWGWEGNNEWEWWRPWKKYGLRFGRLGWDDWAMVIALIFLAGYTTLNVLAITHGGMGKHVYDVSLNSVRFLLKNTFAHSAIYLTLAFFIKLSVLLFYLNLFPPSFTRMRWTIYGLIAFFFIYTIVGTTVIAMVCRPVKAFWVLELRANDSCPSQAEIERRYCSVLAVHVAGDFLVLMLPIRLVSQLQLPRRQKIILVCLFCAGGLACIASILRLYYFPRINASLDITWNVTEISLWGQVEASTAVICASIPALKPLFSSLNKRRKSYRESTSTAGKGFLSGLGSPIHPSISGSHSKNESFMGTSISPSHEKTVEGHSRDGSISALSLSPNQERSVTFSSSRVRSPKIGGSTQGTIRSRDHYDRSLAEIDNINIDIYVDEFTGNVKPSSLRTITPPQRAHTIGVRQGKMHELDDQHSLSPTITGTTRSTNTSSTSLHVDAPHLLSVPREQFLQPPPSRPERPRLPRLRTEFEQSAIIPDTKVSSPMAATFKNDSPHGFTPKSCSPDISKAPPSLPSKTYSYARYSPRSEASNSSGQQPHTANPPYAYSHTTSWDTTGLDTVYDSKSAPPRTGQKSWVANMEWVGWGSHDGMDMA